METTNALELIEMGRSKKAQYKKSILCVISHDIFKYYQQIHHLV